MNGPAAAAARWPERALRVACWTIPPLAAIWFYWLGLKTWFFADDFAWLDHATQFSNFREMIHAIFMPMAQGTIRPWSDRIFFMIFYRLFGLDPLPFHIWVFVTQCANILLLVSVARRLTGSRLAAFTAALFWIANMTQPMVMGWISAYDEPLCAFFILSAFYCLLRYIETGRRRFWIWQWIAFILGFGALELNVVYPALAAAYTFCCARKYFRRTLWLIPVSVGFAVAHRWATGVSGGAYQMHFGLPMLRTLWTYWTWALGPTYLATMMPLPAWEVMGVTLLLTAALIFFTGGRAWRGDFLPLFLWVWYLALIAPVLPLSDHLTEYYPFLPVIGVAVLGGYAFARAWAQPPAWKAAAGVLALLYFLFSVPTSARSVRWQYEQARDVRKVVEGVARAHELHPHQIILLDDVNDLLFWRGILDHPFPLIGADHVYLTPGSERRFHPHPELGDPMEFIIPPGPTWYALTHDQAVVYSARGERLRNITSLYTAAAPREWEGLKPQRVDPANPAEVYLLGTEWHKIEGNHRWMPHRASLQLAGPRAAPGKLYLQGIPAPPATRLMVTVDGARLPDIPLQPSEEFHITLDAPAGTIGEPSVEVVIEVDHTITPPIDGRELGVAFGIIEFR